jgi:hypothetical protein
MVSNNNIPPLLLPSPFSPSCLYCLLPCSPHYHNFQVPQQGLMGMTIAQLFNSLSMVPAQPQPLQTAHWSNPVERMDCGSHYNYLSPFSRSLGLIPITTLHTRKGPAPPPPPPPPAGYPWWTEMVTTTEQSNSFPTAATKESPQTPCHPQAMIPQSVQYIQSQWFYLQWE